MLDVCGNSSLHHTHNSTWVMCAGSIGQFMVSRQQQVFLPLHILKFFATVLLSVGYSP